MLLLWILICACFSLQIEACDDCKTTPTEDSFENDEFGKNESTCQKSISKILHCKDSADCLYVTLPQAWSAECTLQGFYDRVSRPDTNTSWSTYWFPAKRHCKYGPYEMETWGSDYGTNVVNRVPIYTKNVKDVYVKDCLIQDVRSSVIIPEYCSAKHRRNCSISGGEQRKFCSCDCIWSSNENNLFCTQERSSLQNPSEQIYPLDKRTCECFKNFNYCVDSVRMVLSFNKLLTLTIYNTECISNEGHPDYIYCFTDASEKLRKRVKLTVVFHSPPRTQSQVNFTVYQLELEEFMGQYWCEAKGSGEYAHEYKSNVVIASKRMSSNEFAVRLKINNVCNFTNCSSVDEFDFLIDDVKRPIEKIGFGKVRTMAINEFHNGSFADIIVHVSTLYDKAGIIGNFYKLQGLLKQFPNYIDVLYCKSSERCLPEVNKNLSWPFGRQFQTVLPLELCVNELGLPVVTRFCDGDFLYGLEWQPVKGECSGEPEVGEHTHTVFLQSLVNQSMSEERMNNVSNIVCTVNLTLVDLYLVSKILENCIEQNVNSTGLNGSLNIVNGLLEKDFGLLQSAQETLNITDSYLRSIESLSRDLTGPLSAFMTLKKERILFHSFNPIVHSSSGFVIYKNRTVKNIPLDDSFGDIEDIGNVILALRVPTNDTETIKANNLTNVSITAVIYLNSHLFPSNSSKSADLVVNINIPNYENFLPSPLPLLVNSDYQATNFSCAFWDYGDSVHQKKGDWSTLGSNYDGQFGNYSNLHICMYSHLTHLALLVMSKQNDSALQGTNESILDVLTILGSLLSIIGVFGIFLTSCLFRSWRDKTGTQILLHLSVATMFEIIFMYLNGAKIFTCVVAGAVLQYVIISKFSWMLIYAYCQYLRFVRVFGPLPSYLVLKSIVFGWGFGLIPTIIVLSSNPATYYRESFCYPKENYLYLGFYFPIFIILIINLCVFCKIMREVTNNNKVNSVRSTNMKTQHIKLAILLFSVLGIPWLFGLISNIIPVDWLRVIFVYIFTMTSILQGFLMFLFYVIFNKETRESWKKVLQPRKEAYEIFSSKKTDSVSSIS